MKQYEGGGPRASVNEATGRGATVAAIGMLSIAWSGRQSTTIAAIQLVLSCASNRQTAQRAGSCSGPPVRRSDTCVESGAPLESSVLGLAWQGECRDAWQ